MTLRIPNELHRAVATAARRRGVSETTVILDAITAAVADQRPAPTPGLFSSDVLMAQDLDSHLYPAATSS